LIHFEEVGDIRDAIAREKEIKGWRREKKVSLSERNNPTWADLAERLPGKPPIGDQRATAQRATAGTEKQIPHPRSPKAGDWVRDDKAQGGTTP